MGFYNNLCFSFNSYNSILTTCFSIFFITFIENPLRLKIQSFVSNFKTSIKYKLLYITLLSAFTIVLNFFVSVPYNIFIIYIFNFILVYFIFKMNLFKTILTVLISIFIFMISYILVLIPFIKIFNISYLMIQEIPIYNISFLLIFYTIVALFLLLIKYSKFDIEPLDSLNKKSKFLLNIFNIFNIALLFVYLFLNIYYISYMNLITWVFSYIFIIVYIIMNIFVYIMILKYLSKKIELDASNSYNKTLNIIHDTVRAFKHDFNNIITTIGGFISTNDIGGLKKYFSSIENECEELSNLYTLNPQIVNNPGVYNLLNQKYNLAVSNGITFNLSFFVDMNNVDVNIYEFTRILGILLDNAIEASKFSEEKILNVNFRRESKKHRNIFIIQNSYFDKNVNIDEIFHKGVTSKDKHTGLGLWEVKKILNKNNNLNLYTTKDDIFFTQQLEIYDKRNLD